MTNLTNEQIKAKACEIFTHERFFEVRDNFKKYVNSKWAGVCIYTLNSLICGKHPNVGFYETDCYSYRETMATLKRYLSGNLYDKSPANIALNECFSLSDQEKVMLSHLLNEINE